MNVKIDTKEKFTVIKPEVQTITAIMTEELGEMLLAYLKQPVPHIVLNLSAVESIDPVALEKIAATQQEFYEQNCSFIVCCMQEQVEKSFDDNNLLEVMNVTPTESEAWDIVQMEEIERELLSDFDEESSSSSIS
jgi:anti-anti-sigma factor